MTARRQPPAFFGAVRAAAATNWDTLERNPVLGAPWRQLFRQVKSPVHVLSEVLQNADDAGATWARAWVEDGAFYFEHNGEDFEADQLQSLCQFGFSNKRRLHTIGFRGLGFKSLFSYGPRVELTTATLAIAFDENRFTEPLWIDDAPSVEHTRIRVALADHRIELRVEEDIERWANNPVPLLFFHAIRQLELGRRTVSRTEGEPGPAPHSSWVDLSGVASDRVLVIHSDTGEVPPDALEEIRQERGDPDFDVPEMTVDIVTGLAERGRVYVVLPTNVELCVPFGCNAPFIQDPARSGIKDPANSPLNRWLLDRIGALAADTLVSWLGNETLSTAERADAYDHLLPGPSQDAADAGAIAGREITAAMAAALGAAPVVIATDGALVDGSAALDLPAPISGVWPASEALQTFGDRGKTAVVGADVAERHRQRLASWTGLKRLAVNDVIKRLRDPAAVPRPSLEKLAALWAYLEPTVRANQWQEWIHELNIVPVRGDSRLHCSSGITNFGTAGRSVIEDADWEFLRTLVRAVDPEWAQRLQDAREAGGEADVNMRAALSVLRYLKLDQPTSVGQLIASAAATLGSDPHPAAGVRLAHVAARADVQVDLQFRYRTENGGWLAAESGVVRHAGAYQDLFPEAWKGQHALHSGYEESLSPDMLRIWREWVESSKSRVRTFPVPSSVEEILSGTDAASRKCASRGNTSVLTFQLVTSRIELEDYDFPPSFWSHWDSLANYDGQVWTRVVGAVGAEWGAGAEKTAAATLYQSSPKYRYKVGGSDMPAEWLHRLRGLPCVPDERGAAAELLSRSV